MPALAVPGAIEIVMIAVLGAILIWASRPLWQPLLGSLADVPFIGPPLAGRIEAVIAGAINRALDASRAAVAPLAQAVYNFAWGFYFYRDGVANATESTFNAVNVIVRVRLPQLEGRAAELARLFFTQSLMYTQLLFTQSLMYTQLLVTQTQMLARLFFTQSLMYTELLVTQTQMLARLLAHEQALYAERLFRQAVGYAEDAFGRAIELEQRLYGDLVHQLERGLEAERAYAERLAQAAVAAAAVALGAVAARVAQLERSPCQKFCNPLGDLGQDLDALGDLFAVGALFALAGAAARDPRSWARDVAGDLSGPLREVTSEALGLVGRAP